jgi:hypothetical protein
MPNEFLWLADLLVLLLATVPIAFIYHRLRLTGDDRFYGYGRADWTVGAETDQGFTCH